MPPTKIPARDITIQVQDDDGSTWLDIGGEVSATYNPGENEETADVTTFASGGNYEQWIVQRGASLALEGLLLKDSATGAQDPGQARCEDLASMLGAASLGMIRFRHPMDTKWKVWNGTFSLGEQGGGNNDITGWSVTVTRSGASTTEDVV